MRNSNTHMYQLFIQILYVSDMHRMLVIIDQLMCEILIQ